MRGTFAFLMALLVGVCGTLLPAQASDCDFKNKAEYFDYLTGAEYFETWWTDERTGEEVRNRLRFSGTVDAPVVESNLTKPGGKFGKKWWEQPNPIIVAVRIFEFRNRGNSTEVITVRTSKTCRTYFYPNNANNFERKAK